MPLDQYLNQLYVEIDAAYQEYSRRAEICEDLNGVQAKSKTADRRRNQMLAARAAWRALEDRLQNVLAQMPA